MALGGMDTTGYQLVFLLALLVSSPGVVEKLIAKLKEQELFSPEFGRASFRHWGPRVSLGRCRGGSESVSHFSSDFRSHSSRRHNDPGLSHAERQKSWFGMGSDGCVPRQSGPIQKSLDQRDGSERKTCRRSFISRSPLDRETALVRGWRFWK